MEDEWKKLVNNLTQDILNAYEIQIPIRDIDAVVEKLGGRIEECPLADAQHRLKKQKDRFVLYVSPYWKTKERTFAIAQELGHLFLHMGYRSSDLWARQEESGFYRADDINQEWQANAFAAAFLMPERQYKDIVEKYTTGESVDVRMVAASFDVSVSAAYRRGRFLGVLQKDVMEDV
jgi:Zn-dependent peptidase ImmA (M78 family)